MTHNTTHIEMGELDKVQAAGSPGEFMSAINEILTGGLGFGILLAIFVIAFYKLSDHGTLPAFTAASFVSSVIGFLLAAEEILAAEIPYLVFIGSIAGIVLMWLKQRV